MGRGAEGIVWSVVFDGTEIGLSGHGLRVAASRGSIDSESNYTRYSQGEAKGGLTHLFCRAEGRRPHHAVSQSCGKPEVD